MVWVGEQGIECKHLFFKAMAIFNPSSNTCGCREEFVGRFEGPGTDQHMSTWMLDWIA